MDSRTNKNLVFRLDDGQEINIEAFMLELLTDETFEGSRPDLTVQHHLKKVELLSEVRDPHLIFSDEYDGTVLPPYVVTVWLEKNFQIAVVVFFCYYCSESIPELCRKHLHQVEWNFLTGTKCTEGREWFDWMDRDSV